MTLYSLRDLQNLLVSEHAALAAQLDRGDFSPEDAMKACVRAFGALRQLTDHLVERETAIKAQLDGYY